MDLHYNKWTGYAGSQIMQELVHELSIRHNNLQYIGKTQV